MEKADRSALRVGVRNGQPKHRIMGLFPHHVFYVFIDFLFELRYFQRDIHSTVMLLRDQISIYPDDQSIRKDKWTPGVSMQNTRLMIDPNGIIATILCGASDGTLGLGKHKV